MYYSNNNDCGSGWGGLVAMAFVAGSYLMGYQNGENDLVEKQLTDARDQEIKNLREEINRLKTRS